MSCMLLVRLRLIVQQSAEGVLVHWSLAYPLNSQFPTVRLVNHMPLCEAI
jgi:hypothetical protein